MIRNEINDVIYPSKLKVPGQGIFFRDKMIRSENNDVIYSKSEQTESSWARYIFS
jgi:hypothetical protein